MFGFIAAHGNVWQGDHGRQPGLLQPSAGNSPEDNANERSEEETESKLLLFAESSSSSCPGLGNRP